MECYRDRIIAALEPDKIRAWLAVYTDDTQVGVARSPYLCPLSRYLSAMVPLPVYPSYCYVVLESGIRVVEGKELLEKIDHTPFSRFFVEEVDVLNLSGVPTEIVHVILDTWDQA